MKLPSEIADYVAMVLALAAFLLLPRVRLAGRRFVLLMSVAAAALSALYVVVYLRGGPRIIDATSYWLEARGFSRGLVAWPLGSPEASTLGRFLVRSASGGEPHAAVIFPPGYPALLAAGFLVHAPMAVGPLLAAILVALTYDLAKQSGAGDGVAAIAAVLSVVCAALRYHTADTMSHGLAALCVAGALTCAFRATSQETPKANGFVGIRAAIATGGLTGWLVATRPVSGIALGLVLSVAILVSHHRPVRSRLAVLAAIAIACVPGMLLLVIHQRLATGAWGVSSQGLYYATSDGPPGCFRYGFGERVGCLGEHGDFVRARLADGFGVIEAAGTTLRRLKQHLVDPANFEPFALLAPLGALAAWKNARVRILGAVVVAQIVAYAPFYFDGNYPGGGARFYADVLPVEHVLIAIAVVHWADRWRRPTWAATIAPLALVGFAFRASADHAALRDREGGRPMCEPDVLALAPANALVFFDTDHGFDLAFDPGRTPHAARFRGDSVDRMRWESLGRPPAFRYRFEPPNEPAPQQSAWSGAPPPARAWLEPLRFLDDQDSGETWTIEGESLWPARAQDHGWALPEFAQGTCASQGKWLRVRAEPGSAGSIRLGLPAAWVAGRSLAIRLAVGGAVEGEVQLTAAGLPLRTWPLGGATSEAQTATICYFLDTYAIPDPSRDPELVVRLQPTPADAVLALDRVDVHAGKSIDP